MSTRARLVVSIVGAGVLTLLAWRLTSKPSTPPVCQLDSESRQDLRSDMCEDVKAFIEEHDHCKVRWNCNQPEEDTQ